MLLNSSLSGDVVFGKIVKWKKGHGMDENRLTIVTIFDFQSETKIKALCWDQLSDRARTFQVGDPVSMRARFDRGDEHKCVVTELKKGGIYDIKDRHGNRSKALYGQVKYLRRTKNGIRVAMPLWTNSKMSWCCADVVDDNQTFRKNSIGFLHFDRILKPDSNILLLHATGMTIAD